MKKIRRALVLPALILCTIVLARRLLIRAIVGRPTELVADDDSATPAADMGGWIINTTAGAAVNSSPHVVPPDAAAALEDGGSSNRTTLTATHQDEDDLLLHSATANDTSSSLGYGNYSLRGGATIGKIETYASHRLRGAAATTRHHHNSSSLLIRHANETDAAEASAPSSPSLRGSYDSSPLPAPILGRRNTIISSSLPLHHQRSSGLRSNKNLLVVNPPTPLPTPITMLSQHTGGPVHIIHRETDTVSTTPAPSPSSIPQQVAVHGPVHIIHHVTTTTTEEPPSMEQLENRVLPIDCEGCYPIIDIDGDTAVMFIQKEAQIHFLSYTTQEKTQQQQQQQRLKQQKQQSEAQEKFQITTTLNVDFEASAVSISGNIAVVGSSDEGKVYIFEKDTSSSSAEDSWKQVFELSVTNVSYFGSDVSVDNDVLVVGATGDALVDDSGTGATYVYRRDASSPVWIQEAKLVANDNKASYEVYGHVASVKGNFIVTGDEYYDNSNRLYRAVHVYEYDSLTASWTLVADSIANDDCELGIFGTAVEVTDIGNVLISCQRDIHGHTGAVFYYTRSSSSDSVQYVMQQKIIPSDGSAGDEFGGLYKTIAVDGNMLSIGTGKKNRIYTFTLEEESNLWTETSKLDPPAGLDIINFGSNLSLSGNRVLARSSRNVYSYTLP